MLQGSLRVGGEWIGELLRTTQSGFLPVITSIRSRGSSRYRAAGCQIDCDLSRVGADVSPRS